MDKLCEKEFNVGTHSKLERLLLANRKCILRNFQLLSVGCVLALLSGCGQRGEGEVAAVPNTPINSALHLASAQHGIPVRFLKAVAFYESDFNASPVSIPYIQTEGTGAKRNLSLGSAETAFGLSAGELGLSGEGSTEEKLIAQVNAYAAWLRSKLDDQGLNLNNAPATPEDKFRWIWELAKIHRQGEDLSTSMQLVFAEELIQLLNEGRVWQDAGTGEDVTLTPESPVLDRAKLPSDALRLFQDQPVGGAEIANARRFFMPSENQSTLKNEPKRIIVTHCPLNLSACLQLQDPTMKSDVRLGAHYIIPDTNVLEQAQGSGQMTGGFGLGNKLDDRPIQVLSHSSRAYLTDASGVVRSIPDAIVVMLVGRSGRYVEGLRQDANPTWYTSKQLSDMAQTIIALCVSLRGAAQVNYAACKNDGGEGGIDFRGSNSEATYRWGEIPDFERDIFMGYLEGSNGTTQGSIALDKVTNKAVFAAGEAISLRATFQPNAASIEFQRALRCRNGQIAWKSFRSDPLPSSTGYQVDLKVFDGGPNQNGKQYVRAFVADSEGKILGWDTESFYISKFDPKKYPPGAQCDR